MSYGDKMETEEIRYLTENQFNKILEKSERLAWFNRYGVGFSRITYLVLTAKGKLMELIDTEDTDQRNTWCNKYIRPVSPREAIDLFDLTMDEIKEMAEPARKIFLEIIEKEPVPDF